MPEPDFCRIWKKCRIPAVARAGAEIRYSPDLQCRVGMTVCDVNYAKQPRVNMTCTQQPVNDEPLMNVAQLVRRHT